MERIIEIKAGDQWEIRAEVWVPDAAEVSNLIYMHEPVPQEMDHLQEILNATHSGIIFLCGVEWNRDMTPWPAERVFKKEEDFSGKAEEYLEVLTGEIVPALERKTGISPVQRSMAGYSLGGLFALYVLFRTDLFQMAASVSGSLWYDGWLSYIAENSLKRSRPTIYISLGDKEKETRNARMAIVEEQTLRTVEILAKKGAEVFFERNPGNHFSEVEGRIIKAVKWLAGRS